MIVTYRLTTLGCAKDQLEAMLVAAEITGAFGADMEAKRVAG